MAPRAGLPGLNKLNGLWWQPGLKARSDAKGRFPALSNAARRAHGKVFEFHTFENAGHAFFSVDRPNYRVDAAREGWKLIWDFFGRYLAA